MTESEATATAAAETKDDAAAPKSPTKGPGAESDPAGEGAPFAADPSPHGEPFGLACVLEIFRFSTSFISLEDGGDESGVDVRVRSAAGARVARVRRG